MRPDVLVTWPQTCDYPLWRWWLADERDRFARVIVAFSPMPGMTDLRESVRAFHTWRDVEFIDTRWEAGRDWRDAAVNLALDASDAEWVWFTEMDFFVLDPFFWRLTETFERHRDAMGVSMGEDRWHPCCLFVRREAVERTSRNFAVTDDGDHFALFGRELEDAGVRFEGLDDWQPGVPQFMRHMAGLSHNHHLVERGESVTYNPDEFAAYLRDCLRPGRPDLDPRWRTQAESWLSGYDDQDEEV